MGQELLSKQELVQQVLHQLDALNAFILPDHQKQ